MLGVFLQRHALTEIYLLLFALAKTNLIKNEFHYSQESREWEQKERERKDREEKKKKEEVRKTYLRLFLPISYIISSFSN